ERHPQRELTHDQLTEKFRQAISKNDDKGVFKNYAKSLDGWAQSLEDRNRELDALERRLDMQEKMLRKEIDQTLARQAREAELAKGAAEAIERGKENNAVETGKTVDVALEAGKSTEPKAVQATPADGRAADATPVSVEAKAPSIEGQATAAKSDAGRAAPTEAKTVSVEPPVREQPAASAPSIAGNAQYRGDPRLEREAERMSNLLGVPMAEARQTVMDLVSNYEERGAEWARERFWKEREGLHREIQTAEREAASASLGKDVPGELLALLQQEISRGEQHRAREAERGAAPAGLETPAVDGKQTDEPTHAKTSDSPADGAQRSAETPTIEQKEAALDGKSTQTEVAGKEASTLAQGVLELTTGEGAAELSKAAREVSAALDASARSTEQQQAKATPANGTGKEAANQSAERAPAAAAPADGAGKEAASQSSPERSPSRQSPGGHFSKLSKAEQRERREAFSGQLNQLAGFSRDGTQIVSEKLRAEMSARGDRGYGRGD
ncbi:hypothetical protein, partial [Burkholderia cepacia]|uniref:hypothetical protein n=1 Tax=Burkholderia cepacia TaxID=292 RepID=UPI002ABD42DC